MKKTALKTICCGRIREHVDWHEETKTYEELRGEALKKQVEANKTTTATGMDVGSVEILSLIHI